MPTASGAPSPDRLMQFAFGFAAPLIIETAIRHRVFVVLAEGAKSLEEICAEISTGWLREAGFNNVRTVDAPGLAPLLILATKPNS